MGTKDRERQLNFKHTASQELNKYVLPKQLTTILLKSGMQENLLSGMQENLQLLNIKSYQDIWVFLGKADQNSTETNFGDTNLDQVNSRLFWEKRKNDVWDNTTTRGWMAAPGKNAKFPAPMLQIKLLKWKNIKWWFRSEKKNVEQLKVQKCWNQS